MESICRLRCATNHAHTELDLTARICNHKNDDVLCRGSIQKECSCGNWVSYISFARHRKSCTSNSSLLHKKTEESIKETLRIKIQQYECIIKNYESRILSHKMDYWPKVLQLRYDSSNEKSFRGQFVGEMKDQLSLASLMLIHRDTIIVDENNTVVGGIAYEIFTTHWANDLLHRMRSSIKNRPKQKRSESRKSEGIMTGIGLRPSYNHGYVDTYSLGKLDEDTKRWEMENGEELSQNLYTIAQKVIPFATADYDQFKEQIKAEIGVPAALFATKNYVACGHTDNDWTEYAIGFVTTDGQVNGGLFFYPPYNAALKLEHNCMWWWKTDRIHGTSVIDHSASTGSRYTAVLTLSKRTAQAVNRTMNADTVKAKKIRKEVLKINN